MNIRLFVTITPLVYPKYNKWSALITGYGLNGQVLDFNGFAAQRRYSRDFLVIQISYIKFCLEVSLFLKKDYKIAQMD